MGSEPARAVALGGGTGLPGVLRCLLDAGFETTAVVTMADDGGSSGTLRRELGMLPPGDIRNCLVAMADPDSEIAGLFQYRFPQGAGLEGHALGNLIIAALSDMHGGFIEAVEHSASMLGTRGAVLPSTLASVGLCAVDSMGRPVAGQALIANTPGPFCDVVLDPPDPDPYPPAIAAIEGADVIVIGPGSLFTSILPNFLVSGVADAVRSSAARKVYICNVANQRGETSGMDAADHVETLLAHGLSGALDVAVLHRASLGDPLVCDDVAPAPEVVCATSEALARIESWGVGVVIGDLADRAHPARHDQAELCRMLREVL